MTFSYFPGCTLKTKGARLDRCAQLAAKALGFTLEELPEWQCCGAVYPMARDEVATRLSSVRALVQAKDLEVLRDKIGWNAVKAAVKKPLTGRKIGAYYGCLLLRPSREMGFDDPENPTILEDFIRALGAEPVYYALRNECCGGYTTLENRGFAAKQAQKIADNAKHAGAEVLITACPLCMYNLSQNTDGSVPVRYFTELLAEALGAEEA